MNDETEKLPVWLTREDQRAEPPIGHAKDKREAAKIIREKTGDPDFRARDVTYSPAFNCYLGDES
jgi:hypothetical protein